MIEAQELHALLENRFEKYNEPGFIESDPIYVPHQFQGKEDIEISGFLTALIAWGRRSSILQNALAFMERMDFAPYQYVMDSSDPEREALSGFVHRTFNYVDAVGIIEALRQVYLNHEGLEGIFSKGITPEDEDCYGAIVHARTCLMDSPTFQPRTGKHLANPAKGSAAKRINMFLRWMVRQDTRGVDFGIWQGIRPAQLICPLDVHTGNVARKLGLLERKQNDWKAAVALTSRLRAMCPEDPVKYDFSLFGLGVFEGF